MFKPAHLSAIGTFQDGGLKHNNPVNLALWEFRQIWPSIMKPDIVISLGTGIKKESTTPIAPSFRHIIRDGFIPRLYRSFMSSLDGQNTWRDLQNRLDEKSREDYFRLNVVLSSQEMTMDNVDCMENLRKKVHAQTSIDEQYLKKMITALLVANFYFEFTAVPVFKSGFYHCHGTIRCRFSSQIIEQTMKKIQKSSWLFVTETEILGYCDPENDFCETCHRYQNEVHFLLRQPTDSITIYMENITRERRRISGFPQTMQWFLNQQYLNADFGMPTHQIHSNRACSTCSFRCINQTLKRKFSENHRGKNITRKRSRKNCK